MKSRPDASMAPDNGFPGGPLTGTQFHILLTLAEGERHGYAVMQEIERRTEGELVPGPGTLYRSIKQLLTRGLIVELDEATEGPPTPGKRRRVYALTPEGRTQALGEARRLRALALWAEEAMALEGGQP